MLGSTSATLPGREADGQSSRSSGDGRPRRPWRTTLRRGREPTVSMHFEQHTAGSTERLLSIEQALAEAMTAGEPLLAGLAPAAPAQDPSPGT